MRNREGVRPLDVLFDDALRKCDGALLIREGIEDAARTRRRDLLERCGLRRLHALYRDDQHPELDGSIAKGTLVHVAHDLCPESGEAPYTVEFPVPREKGEVKTLRQVAAALPSLCGGLVRHWEVIGHATGSYVVRYVTGPTSTPMIHWWKNCSAARSAKKKNHFWRDRRACRGDTTQRSQARVSGSGCFLSKRDFAPYFTLTALLVYWVKFFVDLSGGDEVMGSLDDALEAVAPFADECALQTHDFRRLFTYQFVHVDAWVIWSRTRAGVRVDGVNAP